MYRVFLDQRPGINGYQIHIGSLGHNYNAYLKITAKGSEWVEVKDGDPWKPTLTLDPEITRELAKEMARLNIKTPDQNNLEGKLGATERHLEDMRTLVFKKK